MKIFFVLIFCVILFVISSAENSFGQVNVAPSEHPSLPEVSLQIQLRNSEGHLVTYLEPTTMFIRNVQWVHDYLDTVDNKKIIEKDGKTLEQVQYIQTAIFSSTKQIATQGMVYQGTFVLLFRHDGYITQPGDTLEASWKILRTIQ